jgi:hypothetical protein
MKGANGLPHHPEPDENPAGDQDIDTAGTEMDDDPLTRPRG